MKKIILKKYDLKTNKTKETIRISLLSDIHISEIFKIKKLGIIINKIKKEKPDYICIPGDIIDSTNVLDNNDLKKETLNFLKGLSKISKVIISIGNHDVYHLNKSSHIETKKWTCDKREDYFEEINKIPNVHLLDDETYIDKNIAFTGITLSYRYYKETHEDKEEFYKEIKNKKIKLDKNKYNILLCHTPVYVLEDLPILKDSDLILSGHMHNGMVHPLMEKIWKGNSGIITPTKKLYPKAKLTRGRVSNKKELIISGGITKLSYSSPNIFHPFNDLYPMNIEIININK